MATYKSVGVLRFQIDPSEDDVRWIQPGETFSAELHPDREKFLVAAGLVQAVIVPATVKFTERQEF